jgi:hypothetical protein
MTEATAVTRLGMLAREVFSWDAEIRWIALEDPGGRPQLEWRDPDTRSAAAAATPEELTIDPLLLMLAENRRDRDESCHSQDPSRLRFVVLAYGDRTQVVMRFGRYGYVNVGVGLGADAYRLGTRLSGLLDQSAKDIE